MRSSDTKVRLGELLVAKGAISPKQLEHALEVQSRRGGKLAEVLLKLAHIDQPTLDHAIATTPGVASVDLARYRLSRDLCELIPQDFAVKNLVFPIDRMGKTLTIAMAVPLDTQTIEEVHQLTGMKVKAFYSRPDAIRSAIRQFYRPFGDVDWSELLARQTQKKKTAPPEPTGETS